jgi:hypothetical protein
MCRVQAFARVPVIPTAAKHGSLLSLSTAFSPAWLATTNFWCQRAADSLDQQRHLIGHEAHVTVC